MTDRLNIKVVLGSVREGRAGARVADWITELASKRPELQVELLDLKNYPLPHYDEAQIPFFIQGQYQSEVARNWVAKLAEADGFIFVTPEYNHGYPAALKDAIDYGFAEWRRKPVAFVGYSATQGAAARSIEQLRQVIVNLELIGVPQSVQIPFIQDADLNSEGTAKAAAGMLDALVWWTQLLQTGRHEEARG